MGQNYFDKFHIRLLWINFLNLDYVFGPNKITSEPDQIELDPTKTNWTGPKWFGWSKIILRNSRFSYRAKRLWELKWLKGCRKIKNLLSTCMLQAILNWSLFYSGLNFANTMCQLVEKSNCGLSLHIYIAWHLKFAKLRQLRNHAKVRSFRRRFGILKNMSRTSYKKQNR